MKIKRENETFIIQIINFDSQQKKFTSTYICGFEFRQ